MSRQAPLVKPGEDANGDIALINGEVRIIGVGTVTHGPDDYETVLRWYLPKTRADIVAVRKWAAAHKEVHHA